MGHKSTDPPGKSSREKAHGRRNTKGFVSEGQEKPTDVKAGQGSRGYDRGNEMNEIRKEQEEMHNERDPEKLKDPENRNTSNRNETGLEEGKGNNDEPAAGSGENIKDQS